MSRTLKKVNVRFDEKNLVVDETFPADLEGLIEEPDYEAVIRKINVELNLDIIEAREEMRKWSKIFASTALLLVGLVFSPVVAVKARRYREALMHFWDDVKAHLSIVNRRANAKRGLKWVEWHIKQSGYKKRGTDVFDPYTVFQVLVVVKQRPQRSQQYVARQLDRQEIQGADADTSYTGQDSKGSSAIPESLLANAGMDRKVSFVTPFDSTSSASTSRPTSDASISGAAAGIAAAAVVAGAVIASDDTGKETVVDEPSAEAPVPASALDSRMSVAPIVVASQRPASTSSIDGVDLGGNRASTYSLAPITEEDHRLSSSSIAPLAMDNEASPDRSSVISLMPIQMDEFAKGAPLAPVAEENEEASSSIDAIPTPDADEIESISTIGGAGTPTPSSKIAMISSLDDSDSSTGNPSVAPTASKRSSLVESLDSTGGEAEDAPENFATRILSDSESGSII